MLQVMGILGAMLFVRMGLEPLVKALRSVFRASVPWEKSSEFHILREVWPRCCRGTHDAPWSVWLQAAGTLNCLF